MSNALPLELGLRSAFVLHGIYLLTGTDGPRSWFPLALVIFRDLRRCGLTTLPAGVFSPLVNLVDL